MRSSSGLLGMLGSLTKVGGVCMSWGARAATACLWSIRHALSPQGQVRSILIKPLLRAFTQCFLLRTVECSAKEIPIQPQKGSLGQWLGAQRWNQRDLHATPYPSTPQYCDLDQVLLTSLSLSFYTCPMGTLTWQGRCEDERRNAGKGLSVMPSTIRREILLRIFQQSRMLPRAGGWRK